MHLIEAYSANTRLKIKKPFILKKFYPLPTDEKYITVQSAGAMDAKNYDYLNEVFGIIAPILRENKIQIIQLGSESDPMVSGVLNLNGKTDIHQSTYILEKSILHIGIDSCLVHIASGFNVPIVALYSVSPPSVCGPFWGDKNRQICLEPNFQKGVKYSYSANENPKSVNTIPPETIINSVFKILGASIRLNRKSLYIGPRFNSPALEYVPDAPLHPDFAKGSVPLARFDLGGTEEILFQTLQGRKLSILTNRPINPNGLAQFKANVDVVAIEFTKNSPITIDYIKALKAIGLKVQCFTLELNGDELSHKRLEFFDHCQIIKATNKIREDFIQGSRKYLNDQAFSFEIKPSTLFKSNKFLLARGKFYLSKFHYLADLPVENFSKNVAQVPDDEEFWREQDYWYVFEQEISGK